MAVIILCSCGQDTRYQSITADYLQNHFTPWNIKVVDGSILRAIASQTEDEGLSGFAGKLSKLVFVDVDYDDSEYSGNLYGDIEKLMESDGLGQLASMKSGGVKSVSFSKDDGKNVKELVVLIDDGSSVKVLVAMGDFTFGDIPMSGIQNPGNMLNKLDNLIAW